MRPTLGGLLCRLRELGAAAGLPVRSVLRQELAFLEASLGRPVPAVLRQLWESYGCGPLAWLRLHGATELAEGLPHADRWLEEGLLPLASCRPGGQWLVRLAAEEDPEIVFADDFPVRLRISLGPLSRAAETACLGALLERSELDEKERARCAARLGRLDPEELIRDPATWASTRASGAA